MIVSGRRIAIALRTEGNQRKSQRNSKRSVLLSCGRFDTCRRSTLSCWRRIRISATSFVLGLKSEAMIWRVSRSNSIIKWQGYRVSASRLAESNFRYTQGWHPLIEARPDWFEVIHLYGTKSGWERLKELVDAHEDSVARHQAFVDRIAPAVRNIHVYWLARRAPQERLHQLRKAADPGRNDLCPCGSGKKFKRC